MSGPVVLTLGAESLEPPIAVADQLKPAGVVLLNSGTVAHAYDNAVGELGTDQFVKLSSRPSSIAEVDSSRNTTLGVLRSMRAKAIRCCAPTDKIFAHSRTFVQADHQLRQGDLG
jgi:hypothetical protein